MMRRLLPALLFVVVALPAAAQRLPFADYVAGLERIHGHLSAKALPPAQREAEALRGKEVDSPAGPFKTDESLLTAITHAKKIQPAMRTRVAAAIEELRRAAPNAVGPADPALLERLRQEELIPELRKGGDISLTAPTGELGVIETIVNKIVAAYEWTIEKAGELLDWFLDFFPKKKTKVIGSAPTGGVGPMFVVVVGMIIVVLAILGAHAILRARPAVPEAVTSEPIGSERDADPLSRGANEWERYAAQLASEKRWREAIRAWYHAVLVTLYAAGILHFRRGRTNWEYIASLLPSLAWRADFVQFTRRFEQEWYGRREGTAEAFEECGGYARDIVDQVDRTRRGAA